MEELVAPSTPEKDPLGQGEQSARDVRPTASLQVPTGQRRQTPSSPARPGPHGVHSEAPGSEEEPVGQALQAPAPSLENMPVRQSVQVSLLIAPNTSEKDPLGQGVQSARDAKPTASTRAALCIGERKETRD